MEIIDVDGKLRDAGKKYAKDLRKDGFLPVVIYGLHKDAISAALPYRTMERLYLDRSTFFSLVLKVDLSDKKELVLIKDYALDPVKDTLTHLDLQRLPGESEEIKMKIALFFRNSRTCPGVKAGGMLLINKRYIHVYCEAVKIVNEIEVDVGGLDKDQKVCMNDLKLPAGMRVIKYRDDLIAKISGGKYAEKTNVVVNSEM